MTNENLCTIAFSAEAFDSAARFYRQIVGWVATIIPAEGEPFDGTLMDIIVGEDDGQYKVVIAKWNEEADEGDPNDTVTLDIYDGIERIEVI